MAQGFDFVITGRKEREPEPRIPTRMEDWDAEFERLTGQRVPWARQIKTHAYVTLDQWHQ